jgi:hypothetical protein
MNPGGGGRSESQSYHDIDPPPTTFNKFQSNLICLPFFPLSFLEASKKCIIIKKKDRRYHIIVLYVGSMYVWRMVTNRSRWIHSFLHYVLCTLTLLVPGHLTVTSRKNPAFLAANLKKKIQKLARKQTNFR